MLLFLGNSNNSSTYKKKNSNYSKNNYYKKNNRNRNYYKKNNSYNNSDYKPTAQEVKQWFLEQNNNDTYTEYFKLNKQKAVQLVNVEKTQSRTFSTFNKDSLRTYMKNPFQYQAKLRELSRFLYRRSQPYRRLIFYMASSFQPCARRVTPIISLVEENNKEEIIKNYYDTLLALDNLNLEN